MRRWSRSVDGVVELLVMAVEGKSTIGDGAWQLEDQRGIFDPILDRHWMLEQIWEKLQTQTKKKIEGQSGKILKLKEAKCNLSNNVLLCHMVASMAFLEGHWKKFEMLGAKVGEEL